MVRQADCRVPTAGLIDVFSQPTTLRTNESNFAAQARQNKRLDVETLCIKLEAYKREQDVVRVRKEKRDALRTGRFVPKAASKQFMATATPAREDFIRRHHSAPLVPIAEPVTQRSSAELDYFCTASSTGLKNYEQVTTMVGEKRMARTRGLEKRDSLSPMAEGPSPKHHASRTESPSGRRRSAPSTSQTSNRYSGLRAEGTGPGPRVPKHYSSGQDVRHSRPTNQHTEGDRRMVQRTDTKETDAGLYRPGDAAKRRTTIELFPKDSTFVGTSPTDYSRRPSVHALQTSHLSQSLNHYPVKPMLPALEETRIDPLSTQRPKYAPNDRPDWCQRSEKGNSPQRGLHFFPRSQKKPDEGGMRPKSGFHLPGNLFGTEVEERSSQKAQEGHLIAEAVKIIREKERLERRKSVIGFFKKL